MALTNHERVGKALGLLKIGLGPFVGREPKAVMKNADIRVRVDLARGRAAATVWTCDFSYDYVKINAEYRS